MNANTTTAPAAIKLVQSVGNGAAYAVWAGSVLTVFGFFVILFTFDTPAIDAIGQVYGWIVLTMVAAIGVMVLASKILKRHGAF